MNSFALPSPSENSLSQRQPRPGVEAARLPEHPGNERKSASRVRVGGTGEAPAFCPTKAQKPTKAAGTENHHGAKTPADQPPTVARPGPTRLFFSGEAFAMVGQRHARKRHPRRKHERDHHVRRQRHALARRNRHQAQADGGNRRSAGAVAHHVHLCPVWPQGLYSASGLQGRIHQAVFP